MSHKDGMMRATLEPCPDGCSEDVTAIGGIAVMSQHSLVAAWLCGYAGSDLRPRLPTWREWMRTWKPHARQALAAVARSLRAHDLWAVSAFEAADMGKGVDATHWRCDNGTTVGFSHRGWGDFMAILTQVGDYCQWAWDAGEDAIAYRERNLR